MSAPTTPLSSSSPTGEGSATSPVTNPAAAPVHVHHTHHSLYRRIRRTTHIALGGDDHRHWWTKLLEQGLVALIVLNVVAVVVESVQSIGIVHGPRFHIFDIVSVMIFTVEYLLRVWTAPEQKDPKYRHPLWGRLRYMTSPMAIIDLMAILPFYLGFFVELDLRAIRVLRILRVFKLSRYSVAIDVIFSVIRQEARAISAVLFVLGIIIVFSSSLMFLFEHAAQPEVFSDIPTTMWWAVVTLTTLGYGDMTPVTSMGRVLGGFTAITGVAVIALPAGVLANGFAEQLRLRREVFLERVEGTIASGRLTRTQRRNLDKTRLQLGLSAEEAGHIYDRVLRGHSMVCPHCGKTVTVEDVVVED